MARTAPVPNIPAIPGMNPGAFVMGGGGAGGGGGGGRGSGSGSGHGAGTADGGDGADTAQGSAEASGPCGPRSGCPNAHGGNSGSASRGDPVDVVSGRVYTPKVVDLALGGPLPLRFERHYSSGARERDVGLGFGWSHSFSWEVEVRRREILVWKANGSFVRFPRLGEGESAVGRNGWQLARRREGFVLSSSDGLERRFEPASPRRARLQCVVDRHGNTITLVYKAGTLRGLHDAVGREIAILAGADGRIRAIEMSSQWQPGRRFRFASYDYDEHGDLVSVIDAAGGRSSFRYVDHRMVFSCDGAGVAYHFVYDAHGRCIETWGENRSARGVEDSRAGFLDAGVPDMLADGSPAKGFLHVKLDFSGDGYSEVIDSLKLQRFFANRHGKLDKAVSGDAVFTSNYDELGNLTSISDPLGQTRRWERDARGRVLGYSDALGRTRMVQRDEHGDISEITDPQGGVTRFTRDAHGNWLTLTRPDGATWSRCYDARGNVVERVAPNGAKTVLTYDDHGNEVRVTLPNGGVYERTFDELGRMTSVVDPLGNITRYEYNLRGDLLSVTLPTGASRGYEYDGAGQLVTLRAEDGRVLSLHRRGHHQVVGIQRPDGAWYQLRYDREQNLRTIETPAGEVHRYDYDAASRRIAEHTRDGRKLEYRYDLLGRKVAMRDATGALREMSYDAADQLTLITYENGEIDRFEYNLAGEMVAAENELGSVSLERDPMGRITRDVQKVDGVRSFVDNAYDLLGKRVALTSSEGHEERWMRDVMGHPTELTLDGERIGLSVDALGRLLAAELGRGGVVELEHDRSGRLAATRAGPQRKDATGEPDWVGPDRRSSERRYSYDANGWLVAIHEAGSARSTELEHDACHRLRRVTAPDGTARVFSYDAAGNLHDDLAERSYAPGGRLLRRGDTAYRWNDAGQLVEVENAGAKLRYAWNVRGLLEQVIHPDGRTVRYFYDALRRRIRREVRDAAGAVQSATRFVWNKNRIVHVIDEPAGAAPRQVTTVSFYDDGHRPIAQRTDAADWQWLVTDAAGAPVQLVDAAGHITERASLDPWGAAQAATPLRFMGHWHDAETGLHYNRFREYDPNLASYLSPDPLSVRGGCLLYAYASHAPFDLCDVFGLASDSVITAGDESFEGISGASNRDTMAPEVRELIGEAGLNVGDPVPGTNHRVGDCAEIDALSELARARRDDPDTPLDSDRFGEILQTDVDEIATHDADGNPQPCCPACRQILETAGVMDRVTTG